MKHRYLRMGAERGGTLGDHAINATLIILFLIGFAIIFAPLWIPLLPYIEQSMNAVGGVFFFLSIAMILSILWNISFYMKKRKELFVARKMIRWISRQRNFVPRADKEIGKIDRVLKTAIWELRSGEDVRTVVDRLQKKTQGGEILPEGWSRSHYKTAIEHLEDADRLDLVLAWEAREQALINGEMMLWATRAESLLKTEFIHVNNLAPTSECERLQRR